MIHINDKHDCCGCAACVQICPKSCIKFDEDEQGFRYPLVDKNICVDCGLCENVCPVLNQSEPKQPLKVCAAKNPDDRIRMKSSSGGIFTMIAEFIISQGGVVFGARFDEKWEVEHAYAETIQGIEQFRGSKYVQSRVGITYKQAKDFLNAGRKVLYTGTPCQIAGLKKYLRKAYDNLYTIDVVCHGVPSPLVWRTYINDMSESISSISFRDKSTGWNNYSVSIVSEGGDNLLYQLHHDNLYMKAFLNDLCLRPSCFACPAKSGKSTSDLTIADYWGVANILPEIDDNKGISLLLLHSSRANELLYSLNLQVIETDYQSALSGNPSIERSVIENRYVNLFWEYFKVDGIKRINNIIQKMRPNIFTRVKGKIKRQIKKILFIK